MDQEKVLAAELLNLENQYWQAVKDRDIEAALGLTDTPCIVAGANGVAQVDRDTFIRVMEDAKYVLHSFEITNPQARRLSPDVAVLAYHVHENLTVDGEAVSIDCADASTWVRRDGRWMCALHTESLKGDPYGRH